VDAGSLWPRLMHVVSDATREQLQESRAKLDFHVNLFWLSLFAIALSPQSSRNWVVLGAVPPLTLAMVLWLLLPAAARAWGNSFASVFDLYRAPLAGHFGLELPPTLEDERAMWTEVSRAILFRRPFTADYLDRFRTTRKRAEPGYGKLADALYIKKRDEEAAAQENPG